MTDSMRRDDNPQSRPCASMSDDTAGGKISDVTRRGVITDGISDAKPSRLRRHRAAEMTQASPMQGYLQRCYAQCESGDSRKLMKAILTDEIGRITAAGALSTTDWVSKPLMRL